MKYKVTAKNLLGFRSQFSSHKTKANAEKAAKKLRGFFITDVRVSVSKKKFHKIGT